MLPVDLVPPSACRAVVRWDAPGVEPERLATLVDLGLYVPDAPNAADRKALLEFLIDELGLGDEELVPAHEEGRLFALAGDRQLRTGPRRHTLAEAAAQLGVDADLVQRIWRAFGLSRLATAGPVLSDADVEAIEAVRDGVRFFGEAAALRVARVAGAGLARLAEAESAMIWGAQADTDLARSGSEVVTARVYAAIAGLVPKIGRQLDVAHRHHLESSRRHFESVDIEPDGSAVILAIGFADLSGFTALSAGSPLPALSRLVAGFEERATDIVAEGGGRVVKFLGDAVMFVASTPVLAATIARELVEDRVAAEIGIAVRAAVAWGSMVVQDGDYFGPPVNLAARLVAVAEPSSLLADPCMRDALAGTFHLEPLPERELRGIPGPVAPLLVTRRPSRSAA
jgi:class 3 adenylate cyclase